MYTFSIILSVFLKMISVKIHICCHILFIKLGLLIMYLIKLIINFVKAKRLFAHEYTPGYRTIVHSQHFFN